MSPGGIIAGIVLLAMLIVLILPLVQQRPPLSPRTMCKNGLKQIGLALHFYHDQYGSFPPAVTYDQHGHPAHSWRVLILPFMDQQELYDQYRFDEPWNGPHNITLQDSMPTVYGCPSFLNNVEAGSELHTHLNRLSSDAAIVSPDAVFNGQQTRRIEEITDGTSPTIMVAEVRQHAVHWMSPEDVTPHQLLTDLRRTANEQHANHHHRLNACCVDGSVHWLMYDMDESRLHAATTPDGGEPAPENF
jgi:hypothetical protein